MRAGGQRWAVSERARFSRERAWLHPRVWTHLWSCRRYQWESKTTRIRGWQRTRATLRWATAGWTRARCDQRRPTYHRSREYRSEEWTVQEIILETQVLTANTILSVWSVRAEFLVTWIHKMKISRRSSTTMRMSWERPAKGSRLLRKNKLNEYGLISLLLFYFISIDSFI